MEPRAFLDLAQKLSRNSTCEASLRSSVSRGYFALFNLMAQFIHENVEALSSSPENHKKVYYYFYNCDFEKIETIASSLHDLRDERNASDYKLHLDKFNNPLLVPLLFKKAKIAFDSFEKIIRNRSRRKSIVKGIKQYKQKTNQ